MKKQRKKEKEGKEGKEGRMVTTEAMGVLISLIILIISSCCTP